MFLTVHATTAAVIGENIPSVPLAFIIGLISHFILDIIPHGDKDLGHKFFGRVFRIGEHAQAKIRALMVYGAIDAFILVLVMIYLFRAYDFTYPDSVTWAIIGGILPDLLVGIYAAGKFKALKWFYDFHHANHHLILGRMKSDIPIELGIFMQIIVMGILFWFLKQ